MTNYVKKENFKLLRNSMNLLIRKPFREADWMPNSFGMVLKR